MSKSRVCILLCISLIPAIPLSGQVYLHPVSSIAFENVGSCLTTTCGGTYYDDGGASGNYSSNVNGIYRVFCPSAPGQCLTATFSQFDIHNSGATCADFLVISNGSTQNSPQLFAGCGTGSIGPFTGTANGCLGFRFYSNNNQQAAGWTATLSCAPCAGGPSGTTNSDCVNATFLCSNASVPGNSLGPGIVSEACTGSGCPAGGENYSNWYIVQFQSSGTFNFTVTPSSTSDDYDYAVYGPNVSCGSLGAPLRCSDSGLTGATGLSAAATDFSEDVYGDKFTAPLNVVAGQTYYIMVDEWSPTGAGYSLTFGGTAVMSCTQVPVTLISFDAVYDHERTTVQLDWSTASEQDNDYFEVQRSVNGTDFEAIDRIGGAGTSFVTQHYRAYDANPFPGEINYYRLKQVDTNGAFEYSSVQAVVIHDPEYQLRIVPNPAGDLAEVIWMSAAEGGEYRLDVYDCTARNHLRMRIAAVAGRNVIPLDLSGIQEGVYFLTLQGGGEMLTRTFVKK
jgi:hypothetical protein